MTAPLSLIFVNGQAPALSANALNAIVAAINAAMQRWQPFTAYTAGDLVINPSGQIVSANVGFTSGATYTAANWVVVAGGVGGGGTTNASDLASGTVPDLVLPAPLKAATFAATLAAKQDDASVFTANVAAPLETVDLNFPMTTGSANLQETKVNGVLKAWMNEWRALRGTSPYSWGDALVRAVRSTGDGITSGNFVEIEDRRTTTNVMWGRRWADGNMVRNGSVMADTFVVAHGATAPATLPVGTIVIELA